VAEVLLPVECRQAVCRCRQSLAGRKARNFRFQSTGPWQYTVAVGLSLAKMFSVPSRLSFAVAVTQTQFDLSKMCRMIFINQEERNKRRFLLQ
jgi:hypothetical protein